MSTTETVFNGYKMPLSETITLSDLLICLSTNNPAVEERYFYLTNHKSHHDLNGNEEYEKYKKKIIYHLMQNNIVAKGIINNFSSYSMCQNRYADIYRCEPKDGNYTNISSKDWSIDEVSWQDSFLAIEYKDDSDKMTCNDFTTEGTCYTDIQIPTKAASKIWPNLLGVQNENLNSTENVIGYLNPDHPHYAHKLAVAVKVWEALDADPSLLRKSPPKKAMIKWLESHADKLGLIKDNGEKNKVGIEEIAKVANWNIKGGAPKTP